MVGSGINRIEVGEEKEEEEKEEEREEGKDADVVD